MSGDRNQALKFDRLHDQAQALIAQRSYLGLPAAADILSLISELKIRHAELEKQNAELKQARQELVDLHHEFADLYEFAPCGYVTLNALGIITRVNITGVALLDKSRHALLDQSLSQYVAAGSLDRFRAALQAAGASGEKQRLELPLKREKEKPLWIQMDVQADRTDAGKVIQWRLVLVDIDDRKQEEAERKRLEEQLLQSQKMESIGTLAGGIAHEFNNLLMIIMGNHDLIAEKMPKSNPIFENLKAARTAGYRAREVVSQLLDFSRKSPVAKKKLDLVPVISKTLKLIRSLIPANIDIQKDMADHLDVVFADATQVHQVMINLCGNAAEAMREQGGILSIRVCNETLDKHTVKNHPTLKPGRHVKIVIRDTGQGMEPETLVQIFDPYFTTKPVGSGTGMGLAVVYGIVDQHRGEITADSRPGKGSVFTLRLPSHVGSENSKNKPHVTLPTGTERILFVDDEPSIVKVVKTMLERLGYQLIVSTDPSEALRWFEAEPAGFDLLISDMSMPVMTGAQLSAHILSIRPDMPIIICTGYSEKSLRKVVSEMGLRSFALKPVNRMDLALMVRNVLDERL